MGDAVQPAPKRNGNMGRILLVLLVGIIAAAYYILPEEQVHEESVTAVQSMAPQPRQPLDTGRNAILASNPAAQGVHLVDFWAEWCGPCKIQEPIIARLAQQFSGRLRVSKVDVDSSPDIAQRLGVQGVPTLIIFKDGAEAARFVGVTDENELAQTVANLMR